MKSEKRLLALLALLVIGVVVLVMLPFDVIIRVIGPIDTFLQQRFPWFEVSVGKIGHLCAFCVLTIVFCKIAKLFGIKIWVVVVTLLLLGVATELAQLLMPGRTTRFTDLLWNGGGIVLGYVFFALYYKFKGAIKN